MDFWTGSGTPETILQGDVQLSGQEEVFARKNADVE